MTCKAVHDKYASARLNCKLPQLVVTSKMAVSEKSRSGRHI